VDATAQLALEKRQGNKRGRPQVQEKLTELPATQEAPSQAMYGGEGENSEIWELLERKLANPNARFSEDESLMVLMQCIDMGKASASKADGQPIVMVVGNTGAGKSTFINILHGCAMQQYYKPGTKTKVGV